MPFKSRIGTGFHSNLILVLLFAAAVIPSGASEGTETHIINLRSYTYTITYIMYFKSTSGWSLYLSYDQLGPAHAIPLKKHCAN